LLPTYFESTWCKREFAVFEQRSQQQGMLSGEKPEGLIIPVSLHYVADRFPPTLKGMQIDFKYQDFYSPNIKGYRKLKKYQKLQDELKKLAETVARKIKEAPDWHADWQNDECLNPSTMHLEIPYFTIQQAKI